MASAKGEHSKQSAKQFRGRWRAQEAARPYTCEEEAATWYLAQYTGQPTLTRQAERLLFERLAAGDDTVRSRLCQAFLPLVTRLALPYQGLGLPLPDLLQEGTCGLLSALASYDPARGSLFRPYASRQILWTLHNAVLAHAQWLKLATVSSQERNDAVAHLIDQLLEHYGYGVIGDEREEHRCRTSRPIERLRLTPAPLSLERSGIATQENTFLDDEPEVLTMLLDLLADPLTPEDVLLETEEREQVRAALAALPQRESMVLTQRYGLHQNAAQTLKEVAHTLHVSPERVRQIEGHALRTLRRRGPAHHRSHPAIRNLHLLMKASREA